MLAKLTLLSTQVKHADIVVVALGKLTNFAILRLHNEPFEKGELHFHYQPEEFLEKIINPRPLQG